MVLGAALHVPSLRGGPEPPILERVTTDPTGRPEPGTDVLPIFAASAAAFEAEVGELPELLRPVQPVDATAQAHDVGGSGRARGTRRTSDRVRRGLLLGSSALLVVLLALSIYLWSTARAYQDRAAWTERQARTIGAALTTTRSELEGATAELAAVRAQLATAQTRITALADEKAQVGDDREAQRQLVDYQQRVSRAAGTVASALERCVQGQETLIGYLGNPTAYDPAQLATYGEQVKGLCTSATDANKSLQDELSR